MAARTPSLFLGEDGSKNCDFVGAEEGPPSGIGDSANKLRIDEFLKGVQLINHNQLNSNLEKSKIAKHDEQQGHHPTVSTENLNTPAQPSTSHTDPSESAPPVIRHSHETGEANLENAVVFLDKVRVYLRINHRDQLDLTRIMHDYGIKKIEKVEMQRMVAQLLENNPQLMNEFDELIAYYSSYKEISNPSYSRKRIKLQPEVLNEELVLKTPVVTSKEKKRNRDEEIMILCEDDRYEFDMALARFKSALERVKNLIMDICLKKTKLQAPIELRDYFVNLDLRCIQQLYGENGAEILHLLATKPYDTLCHICLRLDQKIEEFQTDYESRLKETWGQVYAQSHDKSLGLK